MLAFSSLQEATLSQVWDKSLLNQRGSADFALIKIFLMGEYKELGEGCLLFFTEKKAINYIKAPQNA